MDICHGKSRFVKIRAKQERSDTVSPLSAEIGKLPFADCSFDLVILNGVLEWAALASMKKSPFQTQLGVLQEAFRVLKKDGYLYLAIENRFALTLLLGYRDEHTRLRFITPLPRIIADIYSKIVSGESYRIYTHSFFGYRKMLAAAGFLKMQFYAPLPGYRRFTYLIPLDNGRHVFDYFLSEIAEPMTPLSHLFVWMAKAPLFSKIYKYFVPDYSIFAQK
jgi:SAM-dependent methyltransferase